MNLFYPGLDLRLDSPLLDTNHCLMSFHGAVLHVSELHDWRAHLRREGHILVATNGCFDLLHIGHLRYLIAARSLGDALLVGINDDASVRALKGPTRPLNPAAERAEILCGLRCVDAVCIFSGARATEFLDTARPDIYVKGGDYTEGDLYPPEVEAVRRHGGIVRILPLVPGRSTTRLVEIMQKARHES